MRLIACSVSLLPSTVLLHIPSWLLRIVHDFSPESACLAKSLQILLSVSTTPACSPWDHQPWIPFKFPAVSSCLMREPSRRRNTPRPRTGMMYCPSVILAIRAHGTK
ncbi:hypothetical protein BZA05DRAFT_395495 [Tricharina praecox]|uniref:uncharacterized protein n=1 Tax=Tricharina praecox TaxID=43433 RepID=UPI00221FCF85|nr:uncharacterized protein BZA05DRAFT_395495 [Tricharina praecox]KAI5854051.1 hypothetical protein BZA05DRAFT_395495 [Tricharina praecox]